MSDPKFQSSVFSQCQSFTLRIEEAIKDDNWDQLNSVLSDRQKYFEAIFNNISDLETDFLKKLIEDILERDRQFVLRVREKQHEIVKQRLLLIQGKRSVTAYTQSE